jgi:hypothetical protein
MKQNRNLSPIEGLISVSGYSFTTISTNIFLIENFIDDEEHKKLLSVTKSVNWLERNMHELPENIIQNHSPEEITKIIKTREDISSWADKAATITQELETIKDILNRIKKITPSGYSINTFESINRQYDGAELPLHRDTESNPSITYSMVLYLKSSSIGGEIYFKDLNISILPPEKSLIIFDGNYRHGVKAASGKDTRYSMPSYMYKTDIVLN